MQIDHSHVGNDIVDEELKRKSERVECSKHFLWVVSCEIVPITFSDIEDEDRANQESNHKDGLTDDELVTLFA